MDGAPQEMEIPVGWRNAYEPKGFCSHVFSSLLVRFNLDLSNCANTIGGLPYFSHLSLLLPLRGKDSNPGIHLHRKGLPRSGNPGDENCDWKSRWQRKGRVLEFLPTCRPKNEDRTKVWRKIFDRDSPGSPGRWPAI